MSNFYNITHSWMIITVFLMAPDLTVIPSLCVLAYDFLQLFPLIILMGFNRPSKSLTADRPAGNMIGL